MKKGLLWKLFQKQCSYKIYDMNNLIIVTATQLAIKFMESNDLPNRFKPQKSKIKKKIKEDSSIEIYFKEKVKDWEITINNILSNIESTQAWRFINSNPKLEISIKGAAYNKDFIDFTHYFIIRRDKEKCGDGEMSCLAQLQMALQKLIDN